MIKVYEVSRKYIMLFMDNHRYLPLTALEIFEIFQKYFTKYFTTYFTPKKFHEILDH